MFKGIRDAHIQQGGNITYHKGLITSRAEAIGETLGRDPADIPHPNDIATVTVTVYECMKACFMLGGADNTCHKHLKDDCEDSFMMGQDKYPCNCTKLPSQMNNFRQQEQVCQHHPLHQPQQEESVYFVQAIDTPGTVEEEGVQMLIGGEELKKGPPRCRCHRRTKNYNKGANPKLRKPWGLLESLRDKKMQQMRGGMCQPPQWWHQRGEHSCACTAA